MSARASDRRARERFRARVLEIVPPGQAVFDFGCGPGLDARHYAEQGRLVHAYDVDPQMCAYFRAHCATLIARGRIALRCAPYAQFLQENADAAPRFDLVTANFGPLNLVDDLAPLFEIFDRLLRPGGAVLASVLNPHCLADLRYLWWWRNLPRLVRRGRYALPGAQARIWRRTVGELARVAPAFHLSEVTPGAALFGPDPSGDPRRPGALTTLALVRCRYLFLLWRRGASGAAR
ncbi:MAG: class I SAM-dependent methyltransferase [Gammaproteobacteria bacterium]|nr:class I SAM-dependent methyltransferase [Gammaproteobacteria bacterium]